MIELDKDLIINTKNVMDFVIANKNKKFHNSDVGQKVYDKLYERKLAGKKTNVKAITSLFKLVNYYAASKMVYDYELINHIESVLNNVVGYKGASDFENLFSEIEVETPDYRVLNNKSIKKIIFIDNELYTYDGDTRVKIDFDFDGIYEVTVFKSHLNINGNCYSSFIDRINTKLSAIKTSAPIKISSGRLKFDKNTSTYKLENPVFYLDYEIVKNGNASIVARYTGLHRSAWICITDLYNNTSKTIPNSDWEYGEIKRGIVYLYDGSTEIGHINGHWDGYYNVVEFDDLIKLLEKSVK